MFINIYTADHKHIATASFTGEGWLGDALVLADATVTRYNRQHTEGPRAAYAQISRSIGGELA